MMSYLEKIMEARDEDHRIAVDTWGSDATGPAVRFRCYTEQKETPMVEVMLSGEDAREFAAWIVETAQRVEEE